MNTNMHNDELKEEYTEGDLKDGVRGKYYAAYQQSHKIVRLDPEYGMNIEHAKESGGLGEDSDADIHGDH